MGQFDDLKGKTPNPLSRVVLGVQVPPRAAPPPPPQRPSPTADTPLPPVHARGRQATQTAMPAPPAPQSAPMPPSGDTTLQSAPQEPPRSLSPIPWDPASSSQEARREAARHGDRVVEPGSDPPPTSTVELPDGSTLNRRTLRRLWIWVGPVVLSVLGTAFGYIRGYAKGLADAAERLARIETRADGLAVRTVKLETRVEGVENAQATEAASNRAERATSLRKLTDFASELEQVKQSTPKIQGLPKK